MLATQSLLQNRVVPGSLLSLEAVPTSSTSLGTFSIVAPTPLPTITNEPPRECWREAATIMMPRAEAVGEPYTDLESASITYALVPSLPRKFLLF